MMNASVISDRVDANCKTEPMRVLLIGGGCRGRELARLFVADGHAVRITTRTEAGRAAIEAVGAECWIGTPDRIASLRYALEGVTVVCWLLGTANGAPELHGTRLEFMLSQVIDTTVRAFVYESSGSVARDILAAGAALVAARAAQNEIPYALIEDGTQDQLAWARGAQTTISALF